MREEHYEILMRTPFKRLIDEVNITIHNTLLDELVEFWSIMRDKGFRVHNLIVPFTTRDVSFILGLEDKGNKLVWKKPTVGGPWESLFPICDELTRVSLYASL